MIKAQATNTMTAMTAGNGSSEQPLSAARMDETRAHFIMDLVALATGVPAAQIRSETRNNARAARARQIAMYLAYVSFQWPLVRIGAAFGRDRTTAGYACRLVEDLRDDRAFDSRLDRLESCLKNAPDPFDVKLLGTNLMEMVA